MQDLVSISPHIWRTQASRGKHTSKHFFKIQIWNRDKKIEKNDYCMNYLSPKTNLHTKFGMNGSVTIEYISILVRTENGEQTRNFYGSFSILGSETH